MSPQVAVPPVAFDATRYRSEILRTAEAFRAVERDSWRIADDTERRRHVEAAYRDAAGRLRRLRERFEREAGVERAKLIRKAFTPWQGRTADRTGFEALVEQLAGQLADEADAYRALSDAQDPERLAEQPHGPLAVFRIAWERGWRDIVELGRTDPFTERRFGRSGIDELLDFDAELARCGPAAFQLARPASLADGRADG